MSSSVSDFHACSEIDESTSNSDLTTKSLEMGSDGSSQSQSGDTKTPSPRDSKDTGSTHDFESSSPLADSSDNRNPQDSPTFYEVNYSSGEVVQSGKPQYKSVKSRIGGSNSTRQKGRPRDSKLNEVRPTSLLVSPASYSNRVISVPLQHPPMFPAASPFNPPGTSIGSSPVYHFPGAPPSVPLAYYPAPHSFPPNQFPPNQSSQTVQPNSSKSSFPVDIDAIRSGSDLRTTLMIRNIPNKYTQVMLLQELVDTGFKGTFDFLYLPIDVKNSANVGYGFINFMKPETIVSFFEKWNNYEWRNFNSRKRCEITYARIQGKSSLISRFQISPIMYHFPANCRPVLFSADGKEEVFPHLPQPPTSLVSPQIPLPVLQQSLNVPLSVPLHSGLSVSPQPKVVRGIQQSPPVLPTPQYFVPLHPSSVGSTRLHHVGGPSTAPPIGYIFPQ